MFRASVHRTPTGVQGGYNTSYSYGSQLVNNPSAAYWINFSTPASADPNGNPLPHPVTVPGQQPGQPNGWKPGPGTAARPVRWGPQVPIPGQSQPNGSWDPDAGHWDINDGNGTRRRYLPDGTEVDHFNNPVPSVNVPSSWLRQVFSPQNILRVFLSGGH